MFDLIETPILSSKATKILGLNQYTFFVDRRLTKPDIKFLFQEIFDVRIISVNTSIPPKKKKLRARSESFLSLKKRVIITLNSEDLISFFPVI
uniref:Large ribosomal subunit protein uL23c n=1 Tax=Eutreptia sp. CCAC 1914B TaxID=2979827 RepID=A0A977K802_9EUGL|nr:ribosomal protein L23 [Eutreptia sp. CCAC 1914B]